jgi:DNA-binding MarR family transcriptional regulator
MPNNSDVLEADEIQALRTVLRANSNITTALDRELEAAHNLGLPDFEVLSQLSTAPDNSLRMTELAKEVLLSPSGLTRRLDGLVKQGLVERAPCVTDGRGLLAVITEAGRSRLEEMTPTHMRAVREHFVNCIPRNQLQAIIEILGTIAQRDADQTCVPMQETVSIADAERAISDDRQGIVSAS